MPAHLLRSLPSVSDLLESPALKRMMSRVNHNTVVARVRTLLDDLKRDVQSAAHDIPLPSIAELAERIVRRLQQDERPRLRSVINATGVLLHPELGGPPLAEAAVEELVVAARDYASVELDLISGERALPSVAVQELLRELCGCEAALVVQHHAAAVWLTLATLGAGCETIVSRGEVVEIDGVKLPALAAAAGATLREVGATHHTNLSDYTQAFGAATSLVLRLEPTDYAIVGAERPPLDALAELARRQQQPLVHDLGYGGVLDTSSLGLAGEPFARASLDAGADLAIFAGDKLVGGPRCGILVGRRSLIDRLAAHPLAGLLAADKLILAPLAGTLRLCRKPEIATRDIPILRLLETPIANLRGRAERLAPQLSVCPAVRSVTVVEEVTHLGPAALSSRQLTTCCLSIEPASGSAERWAGNLRNGTPAVLARTREGRVLFDLRSVIPRHDMQLVEAVAALKGTGETAPLNTSPGAGDDV
jgi:L-seryl-tRNA(Ser) seleniumtransferase